MADPWAVVSQTPAQDEWKVVGKTLAPKAPVQESDMRAGPQAGDAPWFESLMRGINDTVGPDMNPFGAGRRGEAPKPTGVLPTAPWMGLPSRPACLPPSPAIQSPPRTPDSTW